MNCNNYFDMTDQGDSFESWYGLRGPAGPAGPAGPPGRDVQLRGPVATVADLPATAPSGELWLVGAASPYEGYFYNGRSWEDLGQIAVGPEGPTGPQGETGATGVTFTPSVSISGEISWANDGGLPNPESVNIRGPQGPQGRGVAVGGSAGQVLKKKSATNYDTAWAPDPNANIGIVQDTDTATQNIPKDRYVIWHGALYTASAAIASGAALSSSNLTAVTGGGLNDVGEKVSALRNDTALIITTRRWNFSPFVDQVVSLEGGLYLMTIDSRNMSNGNYTGVYIVEINTTFNSHITTLKAPVTPIANASVNKGTLTITPVYDHGFASIVKLVN